MDVGLGVLGELLDYLGVYFSKGDLPFLYPLLSDQRAGVEDYNVGCVDGVGVSRQLADHLDAVVLVLLGKDILTGF